MNTTREHRRASSFSKVFSLSLVGFFILQVAVGAIVIIWFIRTEMLNMQETAVYNVLTSRSHRLGAYLNDRLTILSDYSKLPAIITGVMQPDEQLANTIDTLESLPFLSDGTQFEVQDFQGGIIYSRWIERDSKPSEDFHKLMAGEMESVVRVIIPREGSLDSVYWKLSVPIGFHGFNEGVLSAYFPIKLKHIFFEVEEGVRIELQANGKLITSIGTVEEPSITIDFDAPFSGITLRQIVSERSVDQRIEYLVMVMLVALILGTGVMMLVVNRLGRKLLLVPHERLQEMSEELEKEVEKQTSDLKMRTVQLSIEIRERREAEVEARETGNLVSALLEGIGAAFFIVNPATGKIVRSNSVVFDMFGLAPWQVSDKSYTELFSTISDSVPDISSPDLEDKKRYTEGVAQRADGANFPVSRYLVPMEIRGKKHIGIIMLDITERKNLERRLNTAQKLESVGELASGIAHEINTPIQYVGDSIRFVEEAMSDIVAILNAESELVGRCKAAGGNEDLIERIEELEEEADLEFVMDEIPKACERALEGTNRVAKIVRAMKNFAHPGTGEKVSVDINNALENTIVVSKNEWKYVAEIEKDFDLIPMVKCLPGDINQVLLNVLVNAAHAIGDVVGNSGEKGTITLSTRATDDEVIIKVADTGTGIPEDIRQKIFDPFFTTKEVGRGTGQGLAIVHDIIVERHGGSIDIESEVGKGTTFIVSLPLGE